MVSAKGGILFLCGALVIVFLTVWDIVLMLNMRDNHTEMMAGLASIRTEMNIDKVDRLIKEERDAKLDAITSQGSNCE